MTAANMVAEALAFALAETNLADRIPGYDCACLHVGIANDGRWSVFAGTNELPAEEKFNVVRRDVIDAALAHLAERASRAEEKLAAFEGTGFVARLTNVDGTGAPVTVIVTKVGE